METEKTSQSIFTLLDTLEKETSVPGQIPKMQKHSLPREQFPSSKQFEDENNLVDWARKTGCLHSVLQKPDDSDDAGIQSYTFGLRKSRWMNTNGKL